MLIHRVILLAAAWWPISAAIASAERGTVAADAASCRALSGEHISPVVELYTSEGCSSCPPADRWLASFADTDDAISLAFHVDYWDYIGWKDRFASPRFSARQRARVNQAGGRVTYTPQVMVGSQVQVDWRSPGKLRQALQEAAGPAALQLSLASQRSPEMLQIDVELSAKLHGGEEKAKSAAQSELWVALLEDGLESAVTAGENDGRTLRHQRVVRQWLGPYPISRQQPRWQGQLKWQSEWNPARMRVVSLLEDENTHETLAAVELALGDCPASKSGQ